jgi:hypothetical protein
LEIQIRRNVEAYIDDVVVKSKKYGDLLEDLKETFDNLCKYKMMFNPKNVWSVYRQANCSLYSISLGDQRKSKEGGDH